MGATVVLFAVGARRLIEGPGKDAGKSLLRIKAILEADIVDPLIGVAQIAGGQQQLPFANIAPQALPFVLLKQPLQMPFRIPGMASDIINTQRLMQVIINPLDDSINHLSGNRHMLSPLILHWRLAPPGVK